jgi:hypothetical protein
MLKVVIHFRDGSIRRGTIASFPPHGTRFVLNIAGRAETRDISLHDLKAVFFVKELRGLPDYRESKKFPSRGKSDGLSGRVRVVCADGEILVGYCDEYRANQPGLFLYPPDRRSNNERVYILAGAIEKLEFV